MSQSRSFSCQGAHFLEVLSSTRDWLISEGFKTQQLSTEDGGILLQIEKSGTWKKFIGMSTALNIVFHRVENTINVEIGEGRWADKAVVGTISMLVLWPLAVTSGFGAWQQMKMPEKIFDHIAKFCATQEKESVFSDEIYNVNDFIVKCRDIEEGNRDKSELNRILSICDRLLENTEITLIDRYNIIYYRALVLKLLGDAEQAKEDLIGLVKQNDQQAVEVDKKLTANIYEVLSELSIEQDKYDHAVVFLSNINNYGTSEVQRKATNALRQIKEKRSAALCKYPYEKRQIVFCTHEIPSWIMEDFCFVDIDTLRSSGWKFEIGHPQLEVFYICHPLRHDRYYSLEEFHDKVFDDKQSELVYLLQSIGANRIHIEAIKDTVENNSSSNIKTHGVEDEAIFGVSGSRSEEQKIDEHRQFFQSGKWDIELQPVKSPYIPNDLIWYNYESAWQRIAQSALNGNYKKVTIELRYQEDFSINSKRIKQIEAGLVFFSQKEGIKWYSETEEKLQQRKKTIWKFIADFPV
ncbi:hypothetical protein [Candidatus Electronema sp. JM]|uniref:hypothetical protein n=1 Tax=Candidatus Electronema sp. JM TaxID=3401571 RepID=UPI003AA8799A